MHSYINPSLVKDFSKKITIDDVLDDLDVNYSISNIYPDDYSLWRFANFLLEDYEIGRCNYKAYIEKDMDARLLMELRKSAVFFVDMKEESDFYTGLSTCNTWQEVREKRVKYFQRYIPDYIELDWQYYYLVLFYLRGLARDFLFDFESYFADGDCSKQSGIEDYERGFYRAHMPPRYWR